jgi:serine protease Do
MLLGAVLIRSCLYALCGLFFASATFITHAQPAPASEPPAAAAAPAAPPPPPSSIARTLYEAQKEKLVQIRVLLSGAESQSSAGSGFFVTGDGLIVTNYHVVSQLVWEPERFRAEFVRTDNLRGPVSVVAIDVQHDLAVVRVGAGHEGKNWNVVTLAPDESLNQGDRVFSMGNPLDLGFAISEGTYNGRPERSLYPQLLFTGAMNPGVSGGPAIDEQGRVVGVNVAGYGRSAELTNFQVPVKFVRDIIAKAKGRTNVTNAMLRDDLRAQLVAHQNVMLDALHKGQWKTEPLGAYQIPVIPNTLARCWGETSDADKKNYRFETARCSLNSSLYLDRNTRIGTVNTTHEYSTTPLGAMRFASLRKKSLANERHIYAAHSKDRTASRCSEDFVKTAAMNARVVVCTRAYRKFEGLYDIYTIIVSLDADREGLESSISMSGVDYERGMAQSRSFIDSIARNAGAKK